VAVALLAMLGMAWTLDAPLLMWSGANVFSGKHVQIKNTVPSRQLEAILGRIASKEASNLSPNVASVFGNTESKPEVIVLYLEPMVRTDQMAQYRESLTRLRKEVTSSKSSVVVPFMAYEAGEDAVLPAIVSLASTLPAGAKVVYQGSQRTAFYTQLKKSVSSLEVLGKDALKSENAIFSNGHLDVLIVELTATESSLAAKLAKDDETIAKVQEIVEDATDGNYVALFASETIVLPAIQTEFASDHAHLFIQNAMARDQAAEDDEKNPPEWSAYFPAWFWEGLVSLIVFMIILSTAIYCIMDIQTPSSFLTEKKKNE